VRGIRRTAVVLLAAVTVGGCAGLPGGSTAGLDDTAGAGRGDAGRRLVHVHEFPDMGVRLGPPTGRPRLTWQQAARSRALRDFFEAGRPPELKLADYRNTLQGPAGPVLVWVAVDPASVVVDHGPDFRPARTGPPDRCPLYLPVDAGTGRGYGAWQTCDPPYRG
jgi:hypothetical protein